MKNILLLLFLALAWLLPGCAQGARAAEPLKEGDSKARVLECLGKPGAELKAGEKLILYYGAHSVELINDRVVRMDPQIVDAARCWQAKASEIAAQRAGASAAQSVGAGPQEAAALAPKNPPEPILVISQGGKSVNLDALIVPGKITIIDFYAEWCGPCRAIGPRLEALVKNNPELYLRKIDIVNWRSEVVKQHQIKGVPNIRVFDRSGRMAGQPTHSLSTVQELIRKAQ